LCRQRNQNSDFEFYSHRDAVGMKLTICEKGRQLFEPKVSFAAPQNGSGMEGTRRARSWVPFSAYSFVARQKSKSAAGPRPCGFGFKH
jgi:hypothetical protein